MAFIILAITVITSIIAFYNREFQQALILHPYSISGRSRLYTMLTSGFIHGDFSHLIFNGISFFYFCPLVEYALTQYTPNGHIIFLIMYLTAIVVSDLYSVYRHRDDPSYFSLGASGAISACLFSSILLFPEIKVGILFIPFPISGPLFAILYIGFSIYAARRRADHINHYAHIAGAIYGLLFTMAVVPTSINNLIEYLQKLVS